jgi:hypothetical protein
MVLRQGYGTADIGAEAMNAWRKGMHIPDDKIVEIAIPTGKQLGFEKLAKWWAPLNRVHPRVRFGTETSMLTTIHAVGGRTSPRLSRSSEEPMW